MSTIYELTGEMLTLQEMAEDEDVDMQTLLDTMESVNYEIEDKADAYAKIIKELEGQEATMQKEIDRLNLRKIALENHVKAMKKNLEESMKAIGKTKFKTNLFSFGIQKNPPSAFIPNEKAVPPEFMIHHEPTVDKRGVIEYLKENGDQEWAKLTQSESLRIR